MHHQKITSTQSFAVHDHVRLAVEVFLRSTRRQTESRVYFIEDEHNTCDTTIRIPVIFGHTIASDVVLEHHKHPSYYSYWKHNPADHGHLQPTHLIRRTQSWVSSAMWSTCCSLRWRCGCLTPVRHHWAVDCWRERLAVGWPALPQFRWRAASKSSATSPRGPLTYCGMCRMHNVNACVPQRKKILVHI